MKHRGALLAHDISSIGIIDVQTVRAEGINIPSLAQSAIPAGERAIEALPSEGDKMVDHIILTVSGVERSLAFYEAALAPLKIKFFLPYKGENGHPNL